MFKRITIKPLLLVCGDVGFVRVLPFRLYNPGVHVRKNGSSPICHHFYSVSRFCQFFLLSSSSARLKQTKNTASLALACSGTPTHSVCVWTRSADWYIFFFVRDPLSICLWRGFTRGQIWETELLKENTEFLSCVVYCSEAGSERAEPKPAKPHREEKENAYDHFQAMKDLLVFTNPEVIRAVSGASNKEYSRLLLDHQKHFLLFGFFSSTSSAIFLIFCRLLRH